jgi:MOSC domain-containing protein YiiM
MTGMTGRVVAIHVAAAEGAAMEAVPSAECRADFGIVGDRYARPGSKGQVTLVAAEQIADAARSLGRPIETGATRRNVTIEGVALPEPGATLELGSVLLEVTGPADPCGLMDRCIAEGAREALAGRAGVRARVLRGGTLRVDDAVTARGGA